MGLTISYQLRLPGTTTDDQAVALLERLRVHAVELSVEFATPVLLFTGAMLSAPEDADARNSVEWWLRVFAEGVREDRDGVAGPVDDAERLAFAAFMMTVGEGSEPAAFGLVRPLVDSAPTREGTTGNWQDWFWQGFCKTQYASAVSDDHFVQCHLAVVRMLEEAERIGFDVTVHDEGFYWETRSTERLLLEVRKMNRIMARLAGALHDALPADRTLEAAIFEHPDFEHLEMERGDPPL
ncbi:MAG: hypothetical protein ABI625_13280 [bacterium]